MSDPEIDMAIAVARGWNLLPNREVKLADGEIYHLRPPHYTGDLNAIHEAVAWLKEEDRVAYERYVEILFELCINPTTHCCWWSSVLAGTHNPDYGEVTEATARTRAEAFLRAIGQLETDKEVVL